MPYINQAAKECLRVKAHPPGTAGELNYSFTVLAIQYLETKGECYQTYNDILGALEGAKLELYRRKIAPYENQKQKENGDVY